MRAPCGRRRLGSRRPRVGRCRPPESGCSGMQPQAGGKPHPRLNTGERPIANKYREGKMKRTLRRESKALEIAGREALGARRFGPAGMPGSGRGGWEGLSGSALEAPQGGSRRPLSVAPSIPVGRPASARRAAGGRGSGRADGFGHPLRTASPAVARGAEEEQDPRPSGQGVGAPVARERVGAGNPAPVRSRTSRTLAFPSAVRDAGTAAPSGPS